MAQEWDDNNEASGGTNVKQGMVNLEAKLVSMRSQFSGTAFPTDSAREEGQPCWRTDSGAPNGVGLYRLKTKDETPSNDTWIFVSGDAGITTFAETLLDDADAAAMRATLGLGTVSTLNSGIGSADIRTNTQNDSVFATVASNLSDLASSTAARTNLGLGSLATLSSVGTTQIGDGAVTRAKCESIQQSFNHVTKNTSHTAVAQEFVTCTVTTDWTLTLPAAPLTGQRVGAFILSSTSSKVLTIDGGTKNIGTGGTTLLMYDAGDRIELAYDGLQWVPVAMYLTPHRAQMSVTGFTRSASSSFASLPFDTVDFDNAGIADVTTDRLTIKRDGIYDVRGLMIASQVGPTGWVVRILKNGSELHSHSQEDIHDHASSDGSPVVSIANRYSLAAGDYLEFHQRDQVPTGSGYGSFSVSEL